MMYAFLQIKRPRQFGFDGGVVALREDCTEGNGEMNLFHDAGQLYATPPKIVDSGLAKCQTMYDTFVHAY